LTGPGIARQHADPQKHQEQRRAETQREQAREDAGHDQHGAEQDGYADGVEGGHEIAQILAVEVKHSHPVLIVAKVARQPISANSGDLPDFSGLLSCHRPVVAMALTPPLWEVPATFESNSANSCAP